jgi:uncharacterized repeat protein (TIGR01451 family)
MMVKKRWIVLWVLLMGGVLWASVLGLQAAPPVSDSAPAVVGAARPLAEAASAESVEAAEAGIRVIRSDVSGILFDLYTPSYVLQSYEDKAVDCEALSVAGYGLTARGGAPRLPVRGALVGVPPGADVTLTVVETDEVVVPGKHRLCPAPTVRTEPSLETGVPHYAGESLIFDPDAYAQSGLRPRTIAELVEVGWLRDQRVAQIRLTPFQYDAATGELRHVRRLRVHLRFDGSDPADLNATGLDPEVRDPFGDLGDDVFLNAEAARAWRVRRPVAPVQPGLHATQAVSPAYKLHVDRDGLYEVAYAALAAAGLPVDQIDPRTFQIHNHDVEVAIEVTGEDDGSFDSGDALRFYGERTETRYTDTNVYWLSWGEGIGRRMSQRSAAPDGTVSPVPFYETTFRWEEDNRYRALVPSGDDHWFADYVYATAPASATYTFTLETIASVPYSATMRGELLGFSHFGPSPDHHTRVYLNGNLVDDANWDGFRIYQFEHAMPAAYLVEGVNEIVVELPFEDLPDDVISDIIFVNWFEVDYRDRFVAEDDRLQFDEFVSGPHAFTVTGFTTGTLEAFDVTSPTQPIRIEDAVITEDGGSYTFAFEEALTETRRYLAQSIIQRLSPSVIEADTPSTWRTPAHGADYVIITHGDFYTEVLPLAAHRTAQGLRTAVVDVQDVYDEFSGGVFHPEAIRDFLAYAYVNWTAPAPSYVLLVGDGTYDFKNNYGREERTYMPPYLASVDPWMGETAADNRYVAVHGGDILPDMHLGRLPVSTPDQVAAMVDTVLAYESAPSFEAWMQRVLFVADNPDNAGDFHTLSDAIAEDHLPAPYLSDRIYYKQTHSSSSAVKAAILDAFDEGRLMVNYIGHSTTEFWGFEHFFDREDIPSLDNGDHQPFVVPMTCLEGYYIHPNSPTSNISSFAETLVRAEDKGAIASWSPTGFGVAEGHDFLNTSLYDAIFRNGVTQVGPATTQAKLYLAANTGGYRELIDTYLLFGDPALQLPILSADVSITKTVGQAGSLWPNDTVTYTLSYTNAGPATAANVVITDVLPFGLIDPAVVSSGAALAPRAGSRFVWDVADLGPGEGGAITITAVVSPTFRGTLTNTARIATTGVETETVNNVTDPVIIQVDAPDLSIEKRGPAYAGAGERITYTLAYVNGGSRLAQQVVISDVLASALTDVGVVASGVPITQQAGSRFVWDVADLAPGDEGTITVTARISPTYQGVIANTAVIATSDVDVNLRNNRSDVVLTGVDTPDLSIEKRGLDAAYGGAIVTYTLTYTNTGSAPASHVVITDVLPSQLLTPTVASRGAVITPRVGSRFVWDVADLDVGEGGTMTITSEVSRTFQGTISNTAYIGTSLVEKVTVNNVAGPIFTQVGVPDLVIDKRAMPWDSDGVGLTQPQQATDAWTSRAWAGHAITYTLIYTNVGPAPARDVIITDVLPSALLNPTVVSAGAAVTPQTGSRFVWDVADLDAGEGGAITITAQISPTYRGTLTNTARITTSSMDAETGDNRTGPLLTQVEALDLQIHKTGTSYVRPGDGITYTLHYTNASTVVAHQVVITDLLALDLIDVGVVTSGASVIPRSGTRFVWDVDALAPGSGGAITITARIPPTRTGVLSNTAVIAMPGGEVLVEDNRSGPVVTEIQVPDLVIDKMGPAQVQAGGAITYTVTYVNAGDAPAHHVVLTDTLAAVIINPEVVSSGTVVTPRVGTRFVWDVADLAPGAGGTLTLTARLTTTATGVFTNTARIATAAPELSAADNRAHVTTAVVWHTLYLPLVTKHTD